VGFRADLDEVENLPQSGLELGMSMPSPNEPCVFVEPVSQEVGHRIETFQIRRLLLSLSVCLSMGMLTTEEWLNEFSGMW
jgi:hypothetical protein